MSVYGKKKKKKKKKNKPEVIAIKFNSNIHKPCYNLKALDVGFKPVFRSVLSLFFFFFFFIIFHMRGKLGFIHRNLALSYKYNVT